MTGFTAEHSLTQPLPSTAAHTSRVTEAIDAARTWLFGQQTEAGYWVADFGGDATLEV
jgi:hypothetical protein